MEKQNISGAGRSSVEFDFLEGSVRGRVQEFIQVLREEEVEELLGRQKWERKRDGECGEGLSKRLREDSTPDAELRRPGVRGLEERFVSKVLPLFVRRTKGIGDL
jgi:hypothetical protein